MHIITHTSFNSLIYDEKEDAKFPTTITVYTQDLAESYERAINTYLNTTSKWLPPDAPAHEEQKQIVANLEKMRAAQRKGEDVHFESAYYVHVFTVNALREMKFVKIHCSRCQADFTPQTVVALPGVGNSIEARWPKRFYCPQGHRIA